MTTQPESTPLPDPEHATGTEAERLHSRALLFSAMDGDEQMRLARFTNPYHRAGLDDPALDSQ